MTRTDYETKSRMESLYADICHTLTDYEDDRNEGGFGKTYREWNKEFYWLLIRVQSALSWGDLVCGDEDKSFIS